MPTRTCHVRESIWKGASSRLKARARRTRSGSSLLTVSRSTDPGWRIDDGALTRSAAGVGDRSTPVRAIKMSGVSVDGVIVLTHGWRTFRGGVDGVRRRVADGGRGRGGAAGG